MKTSRFALAAAMGLLIGAAMTPAKAADLGGGCCADLEERVAELEATTARKGNRVVSLQVYGQVNKGLLIWDDGVDSDAFIVDNQLSSSRVGFKGKATIKPGWTAGYNVEFEIDDAQSSKVTQGKTGDDPEGTNSTLLLRQNFFYIESDKLGRISMGHQSVAGDAAYEVNLSGSLRTSDVLIGNSLVVRAGGGTLGSWASNFDAGRNDVVRYDSPSILGFILSASWGDNDYADVALRYKKEFASLRVAAALAYQWDTQAAGGKFETFGGSISVMHVPTGLYAAFQAAEKDVDALTYNQNFWYLQAGIEKKFLPYGATTVYGEYGQYNDIKNNGSEATRWGFGVNQKIDAAAMDIYLHANFWSFDDGLSPRTENHRTYEDLSTVLIGSRIQF